jgi:hypothetical protein
MGKSYNYFLWQEWAFVVKTLMPTAIKCSLSMWVGMYGDEAEAMMFCSFIDQKKIIA